MNLRKPMTSDGVLLFEELMRFLPDGMSANGWAVQAGVSRTFWTDLKRHGNPSRRTLEKLLAAAGSSLAEFEALRTGRPARSLAPGNSALAESGRGWPGAPLAPIPLYATNVAREFGEAASGIDLHSIDRTRTVGSVDRPMALATDPGAYAVTIAGASMWPRFRAGRPLLVSPAAAVSIGDDVLVQLNGSDLLIKELVLRSASLIELRQFNPDATVQLRAGEAVAVHKVVGEAI
jgi:phage repressor protein C with HTH and peptisase S24 domain